MKKKLQVFVSSTYLDLKEERQVAVEAILKSGCIPAGMELFTANSESQWKVIKKWIDESDVYLLILGGRYGSIDSKSRLSYTEMEYRYAEEKKKPIITLVLSNCYINSLCESKKMDLELDSQNYIEFKKYITSKIVKFVDTIQQIEGFISQAIIELQTNEEIYLSGWVRGDFTKIKEKFKIGELSYAEVTDLLQNKKIDVWGPVQSYFECSEITAFKLYKLLIEIGGRSSTDYQKGSIDHFMHFCAIRFFISLGLMEYKKVPNHNYNISSFTKLGIKYNQLLNKFDQK